MWWVVRRVGLVLEAAKILLVLLLHVAVQGHVVLFFCLDYPWDVHVLASAEMSLREFLLHLGEGLLLHFLLHFHWGGLLGCLRLLVYYYLINRGQYSYVFLIK